MCAVVRVPIFAFNEHRAGDTIDNWRIKADQQHTLGVGLLRKRAEGPLSALPNDGSSVFTFTAKDASSATGSQVCFAESFAECLCAQNQQDGANTRGGAIYNGANDPLNCR